jgi:MoxR-like ATPase
MGAQNPAIVANWFSVCLLATISDPCCRANCRLSTAGNGLQNIILEIPMASEGNASLRNAFRQELHLDFIDYYDIVPRIKRYFELGLNICLVGPPGIGKNVLVHQLAGGKQNVRTAIGSQMIPGDLLGRMTLQDDSTVWKEGLLVEAGRLGLTFHANELTGFSEDCLRTMHPILDFQREILVTANSQVVKLHPNFRFIASCNLSPTGIDPLTREFRDRLVYVYMNRLDAETEAKLLIDRHGISAKDADWLIAFAKATRNADPKNGASTRQLEAAARAIHSGVNRFDAAADCILSSIVGNSISQRDTLLNAIRAEGLDFDDNWSKTPVTDSVVVTEDEEVWS